MIGIIDCGINNIGSLINGLNYLKLPHKIITEHTELDNFNNYILPGVGSFDAGITALKEKDFYNTLKETDFSKKKILGICLGMQLLCKSSEEGQEIGLGLIDADVIHLKNKGCNSKIPHVGFNEIVLADCKENFFSNLMSKDYYFIHSYTANINDKNIKCAYTEYDGLEIVAAFNNLNIYGTQFHPEKSGIKGLEIIRDIFKDI